MDEMINSFYNSIYPCKLNIQDNQKNYIFLSPLDNHLRPFSYIFPEHMVTPNSSCIVTFEPVEPVEREKAERPAAAH